MIPALDSAGHAIVGAVAPGGLTATFVGISRFSTIVGLLPDAVPVVVQIKPGDGIPTLNRKAKGTIPVAILSTTTFDVTRVDPVTLRLSGASVALSSKGRAQISFVDVNLDGLMDVVAQFDPKGLMLGSNDTQGVVEGRTGDGRRFRGADSVRVSDK